jgi:hypothetical protein
LDELYQARIAVVKRAQRSLKRKSNYPLSEANGDCGIQLRNRIMSLNLFFHQVKMRRGLPFSVEIPNEETLKTFSDSDAGKGLEESKSAKDMFRKLGI